jgi:hypothetical protein
MLAIQTSHGIAYNIAYKYMKCNTSILNIMPASNIAYMYHKNNASALNVIQASDISSKHPPFKTNIRYTKDKGSKTNKWVGGKLRYFRIS